MKASPYDALGLPPTPNTIFSKTTVILLLLCLSLTGCFFAKMNEQEREYLDSTILAGLISTGFPGKGPIIVAAYTNKEGERKVAHYTVLHDYGEFELLVPHGRYFVFAYWDKNSNLVYDPGEPAGQYGDPKLITTPAGGVMGGIDITIPEQGQDIEVPPGFEIAAVKPKTLYSRQAGAIIDLDDELFSEEHGSQSYWEGLSFFKEIGGNIYFLEEYDPEKIPILFIHGVTGTPRGWKYFIDHIDRTRFQPWLFYYPSGGRIQSISYLLLWKLKNLKAKYDFDQLYITAHSMGGLVARSFIMDYSAYFPYVRLLITLATPWGGDAMAEYGVKQSPVVLPCWLDMQPDSPFIHSLYRTTMPETVSFYMFFGHQGNRNPFRSNNDRTIAFSSLLDLRAQSEAKMNFAFNEDHTSIIHSKEVVDQYNAIIDNFGGMTGGYLKIDFSYDQDFTGKRPEPTLILQPKGKDHGEMSIGLTAEESGRVLGPFPPGEYLASFGAISAIGQQYLPITIGDDATQTLTSTLTPDAIVCGTLVSAEQSKDWAAGMPYKEDFVIQSITLKGAGIYREIPVLDDDANPLDHLIPRNDYYHKGSFIFFGLPDGKYELTVRAQGYQPYVQRCSVKKGEPTQGIVVELTEE